MSKYDEISNSEKIIDSRDVIARIEYLKGELESKHEEYLEKFKEDYEEYVSDYEGEPDDMLDFDDWLKQSQLVRLYFDDWFDSTECADEVDTDELAEYKALVELQEECEGYSDWQHGEVLINADHWVEYVEELAEDLGYTQRDVRWPYNHIDWEAAADELAYDYSIVNFNGQDFYIRNC